MLFIPFITAGFPNGSLFKKIVFLLEEEGAGMIEIGVPYSDPLADGSVIQQASLKAIEQGITLTKTLAMVKELRKDGLKVPLILFTYYNPLLQLGLAKAAEQIAVCKLNGVLVPDLPVEEKQPLQKALQPYEIPVISLISPSSKDRAKHIAKFAEGFIYIVSSLGVTGERSSFANNIKTLIKEVKEVTKVPLVLGFGIKQKSQIKPYEKHLDGYVVGSALIQKIEELEQNKPTDESIFLDQLRDYLKEIQL